MSTSPAQPTQSAKRPLEEASSPSRATDQPDAKRPALDKTTSKDEEAEESEAIVDSLGQNGAGAGSPDATAATAASTAPATTTAIATANSETASNPAAANDETAWIHVRAVISSPEAATIIGKGGENVSNIRKLSGAKCTVSDYQKGAVERILTVSGIVDAVAKVRERLSEAGWRH